VFKSFVHGGKVFLDNVIPLRAECCLNRALDFINGLFSWKNASDSKEARLHDCIDANTHASLSCNFISINNVEFNVLINYFLLKFLRKLVPCLLLRMRTVEQESSTISSFFENIKFLHKAELVAGNKICAIDQICGTNWFITKAQVRLGD